MAAAYLKDDVLAKLVDAFYEARDKEGWTRRDIAGILGCNESHISHILNGRRSNLTLASIATLAKALRKRAELTLVDIRPRGNQFDASVGFPLAAPDSARADEGERRRTSHHESTAAAFAFELGNEPNLKRHQDWAYKRAVPVDSRPMASAAEGIEQ